jgi:hypothetical protein
MLAKCPWKILGILALAQAGIIVCYLAVFAKGPAPTPPSAENEVVVKAAPTDAPVAPAQTEAKPAPKMDAPPPLEAKHEASKPEPITEAPALSSKPPQDEGKAASVKTETEVRLTGPVPAPEGKPASMKAGEEVVAKEKALDPVLAEAKTSSPEKKEDPKPPVECVPAKEPVGMKHPEPVDKPGPAPSAADATIPVAGEKENAAAAPPAPSVNPVPLPAEKPMTGPTAVPDSGPVPSLATAPVKTVVAPKACPWTLRVALVQGKTHLTAQTGKEVRFRVICDRLSMQAPGGNIDAQGAVKLASNGLEGCCDRLTISWQEDQVVLEGAAKLQCRREGQYVELKAARLSLRLTPCQECGEEISKATHRPRRSNKRRGISFVP